MKAWVLHWDYGPLEGQGAIARVYVDKDRAQEDFDLVCNDQSKSWHLTEVPLVGGSIPFEGFEESEE